MIITWKKALWHNYEENQCGSIRKIDKLTNYTGKQTVVCGTAETLVT